MKRAIISTQPAADAAPQSPPRPKRPRRKEAVDAADPTELPSLPAQPPPCLPEEEEDPDVLEEQRWQAEFDRRARDALAGLHLPMLHELLLRMPPLHDSFDADAQIFAERLLARIMADGTTDGPLVERVNALIKVATRETCLAAAAELEAAWKGRQLFEAPHFAEAAARCEYLRRCEEFSCKRFPDGWARPGVCARRRPADRCPMRSVRGSARLASASRVGLTGRSRAARPGERRIGAAPSG